MSSNPRLDVVLKILRNAGHDIGDALIARPQAGDSMRIWIDGVACTFEDVFKMAEQELKESEQSG
jgi:hypothetical protein